MRKSCIAALMFVAGCGSSAVSKAPASAPSASAPSAQIASAAPAPRAPVGDEVAMLERLFALTPETDSIRPDLDFRLADQLDRRATRQHSDADRDRALALYAHAIDAPRWRAYKRRDELLFWYGQTLAERGRTADALAAFARVAAEYPASRHAAEAQVAIAETTFDAGDVAGALAGYRAVRADGAPDRALYVRYKIAWCEYNLGDYSSAVADFVAVASDTADRTPVHDKLATSARGDLVRVIATTPARALDTARTAFAQVAGGDSELRGTLFAELAAHECADPAIEPCIAAYREAPLPACGAFDAGALAYHTSSPASPEAAAAIIAATSSPAPAAGACGDRVFALLGAIAMIWHHDGDAAHAPRVLDAAAALYADALHRFPHAPNAPIVAYYAGELRYARADFCAAAPYYRIAAAAAEHAIVQRDEAAYANILATMSCTHTSDLGPPSVTDPAPLAEPWSTVMDALDLYMRVVKSPLPEVAFRRGRILFDFAHDDDAADAFRALLAASPADETAPHAATLLLEIDHRRHPDRLAADARIACAIPDAKPLASDLHAICAGLDAATRK